MTPECCCRNGEEVGRLGLVHIAGWPEAVKALIGLSGGFACARPRRHA